MFKKLLLFPFGGNAREALVTILAINAVHKEWDVLGFVDDDPSQKGKSSNGVEVLGGRGLFQQYPDAYVLAVPGRPADHPKRKEILDSLAVDPARFATIIHPSASVSPDAQVGHNTLLMPNVVVSCGVSVGQHCVILPNTVISHDTVVGDYCSIGSNVSVSGFVKLGTCCYVGSGTKIRQTITIGEKSLIGFEIFLG